MSKKTCKREKCKYYRPDWGNDDYDYGCEVFDACGSMCIRYKNDTNFSIQDFYEEKDEKDK